MAEDKNNINRNWGSKDVPISAIIFSGKVKFRKLAKSTFIFTAAPALIILLFLMNGYISLIHATFLFGAIFIVALMFNYPYIADLQEITNYVDDLVENRDPVQPELSYLNNVEALSSSIDKLSKSWRERNDSLKTLLHEDEILINSLPNIVLMLDDELNLLSTNQAAKNIFGWNYGEMIGQIISSNKIKELCEKVKVSGEGANVKYEMRSPSYYFFDIRAEKFPINSPNKIAIILVLQNLTDQKKTEKMLSDFVANASHEMKTPLTSIFGFIETLEEVENDPESQKEFLKVMREQSERMNRLINDLLVLSMAESGVNKSKHEKLNLPMLLSESLLNLGKAARDKDIDIRTIFENNLPSIEGNHDEILRVLDNLISNAIKYSGDGKEVIVKFFTADNAGLGLKEFSADQKLLCISVQDFGEGIEEKNVVRLTERFFRVDKSRSRVQGGTGLGLAIVKQIVENHGGSLDIKSKVGEGSVFSVYFPVG